MKNKDSRGGTTPKKRRKRRFNSLCDCRRYLADLINRLDNDEVEAAKAGRLAYMINLIAGIIKDGDLDKRLERIENYLESRNEIKS